MTRLISRISLNLISLNHQKERTSELIAILEEAGGLTVRARNMMSSDTDIIKYQKQIKEFEDWFQLALVKLDKAVIDSDFQGLNLMNGQVLITPFDFKGQHKLVTAGLELTVSGLGIRKADFSNLIALQNGRIDAMNAIDIVVTVRNMIAEHISILEISLGFAKETIELSKDVLEKIATSTINLEMAGLKTLYDLGNNILDGDSLALPAQQDILNSFKSSPNMEDI